MDDKTIHLLAIINNFKIDHDDFKIERFGSGHINDTFLIRSLSNIGEDYLLQKINHFVFKDVDGLMRNMERVLAHLKGKIAKQGDKKKKVLTIVETKTGKNYIRDKQGDYWRMTLFLHGTKSYDIVSSEKQAFQGGMAFGMFQRQLRDLSPDVLIDTIPDFLNIEKRLNDFYKAVNNNSVGRVKLVSPGIDFIKCRAANMSEILQLGKARILPLRITHNDTKFNNVLFDENDNVQCVIDLDTVMPGYVAYDFGDAIRTIINSAAEDEKYLDAIQLNIPLFEAFTKGYLSQTHSFLTEVEVSSLIKGVLLLPYMQAVRFLTDYLEGDVYYKIHFPGHNLQRARAQMQLLKMLELHKKNLELIVQSEWTKLKTIDFKDDKHTK